MKLFIVLCLVALVAADFKDFGKRRGRNYKNEKRAAEAESHYVRHWKRFDEHNAKFEAGKVTFTMGDNDFADKNNTEVIAELCKTRHIPKSLRALPAVQAANTFPPGAICSKDWTSIMQPVVNQGSCGSCWAFATVAVLEALYKRNNYNYVLSPQFLVDCSKVAPNAGCNGGWPSVAMDHILANGMPLNANYPYITANGVCKSPAAATVTPKLATQTHFYFLNGNETLLQNIVSQDGPVVAVVMATTDFMKYTSGVFYDPTCPSKCTDSPPYNHAVVVVGYGNDPLLGDYWLVRNSWGSWGVSGHIRMARNRGNNCNIACYAMYMK